jgi:hypothetical protein
VSLNAAIYQRGRARPEHGLLLKEPMRCSSGVSLIDAGYPFGPLDKWKD